MTKIRQSDITNNSISLSSFGTISFTNTVSELNGNVSSSGGMGLSSAMLVDQPIFIKEFGTGVEGWCDEQDWTIYNVDITTTFPVSTIISGGVYSRTATATAISVGDLIGLYGPGAWTTSANAVFSRNRPGVTGDVASTLMAGGGYTSTELFNGTAWKTSASTNWTTSAGGSAATGAQNATLLSIGNSIDTAAIESFNGSSWSNQTGLSVTSYFINLAGSVNAAVAVGGTASGSDSYSLTFLFNGSSWQSAQNLSVSCFGGASSGSQHAAWLATAGPTLQPRTHLFNGSSWMSWVLSLQTTRVRAGGGGSQSSAFIAGGFELSGFTCFSTSELFNGSSWSTSGDISSARVDSGGGGSQPSGIIAGGSNDPVYILATEIHSQRTYSRLTFENLKMAKNIGVAVNVASTTCNVKLNGYICNLNITSSNIAITSPAQWAGTYLVFNRYANNTAITTSPIALVAKSAPDADDMVIGYNISQTQCYIYGNALQSLHSIMRW